MKTSVTSKVESIQLLRAVAVILVVYVHILDSSTFANPSQKNLLFLENWGAIGLDLFFVISGFIMTVITPSYINSGNWRDFLAKRALRIIPLYWLLSAFSLAISLSRGSSFSFDKIMKTLLFIPLFENAFTFPIIPVGWSLSLEMYFYILIAVLLVLARKNIYKSLVVLLLALSAIGFFLKPENELLRFLFSPLLTEFALGILAGIAFKKVKAIKASENLATLKLLALAATFGGLSVMLLSLFAGFLNVDDAAAVSENAELALFRTIIWGIPSAVFLTGFVLLESLFEFKTPSLFIKLGDASYSCYLLHTTLFIPIGMKLFKLSGISNGDAYVLFSMVIVLSGSLTFYHFFEKRLNSMVHNSYTNNKNVNRHVSQYKPSVKPDKIPAKLLREAS